MMSSWPPYVTRRSIADRLPLIFPEGTPNRQYCVRELAASTIFAALYIGAIEGADRYLGPIHVYRMTAEQAAKSDDLARRRYSTTIRSKKKRTLGKRWYADNTREPIRDETLRDGLVALGAVIARPDLPTTSSAPRYSLKREFAALFDPELTDQSLLKAISTFHADHLSKDALARIAIVLSGGADNTSKVEINFPNGDRRHLAPGPSSMIAKSVIEVFVPRFLKKPAVLWLSESGNKVVVQDDLIAKKIGLEIEADKNLPDLILADVGASRTVILFVEIVATDGAVTARRQTAMYALTDAAGFNRSQIAFVTAYKDRQAPGFRRTVAQLAWRSYAWFMSEPDNLVIMHEGAPNRERIADLIGFS